MTLQLRNIRVLRTLLLIVVFSMNWNSAPAAEENTAVKAQTIPIIVSSKKIRATLANNHQSRLDGLLGWSSIDDESGMLLDFIIDTNSAIHMQGMKFPIDAIWIDSKNEIKLIYRDIQPDKGMIFPSVTPCRYCLEVKSGFCRKYGVEIGQKIRFSDD